MITNHKYRRPGLKGKFRPLGTDESMDLIEVNGRDICPCYVYVLALC